VNGTAVRIPWARPGRLPEWMAAYGPRAPASAGRRADGLIIPLGPVETHAQRLSELAAPGVTQCAVHGMHDAVPETIDAYGTAFRQPVAH
jgi:hypothetical protein